MNNIDSEMTACAQNLRVAMNHQAEVTVTRRITISKLWPEPKSDFCIYFGDLHGGATWKWECAQADTLAETQARALAQIESQGNERKRELQRLQESAARLGLQLVEAPK